MLDIDYALCTQCGQRRANEDELCAGRGDGLCFALLADGAGGHVRGAEAARRAVRHVEAALRHAGGAFEPQTLTRAVRGAHGELRRLQPREQGLQRFHATIVALWLHGGEHRALWTHVGDSRLYRLRHGAVDLVTRDDSVVQSLVDARVLTVAQARNHPHKNQLIAALGIEGEVEPHTVGEAVELRDGDAFLLCSDGWWEPLDHGAIEGTLAEAQSPAEWLDAMRRAIELQASPRQDNFSAVAVWVGDPTQSTRFMVDGV
jgi:serine/threonine protein phosphatase PrpC